MTELEPNAENAGDAGRLDALFQDMIDPVYGFAAARVGRSEADDVTAEVFCAAASMFTIGRGDEVTPAWLMAVAKNKVIDRWRQTANRTRKAHLLRPREAAHDAWTSDDQSGLVVEALDRLDDFSRLLLVLRYVEGYPVPEIARRIDRGTTATASALGRARKKLQRAYEAIGGADGRA